jgi:Fur family zinc uptake transcriptional regulator
MPSSLSPILTPLRREVLDLIEAAPRPVKAYDLLSALSARRGRMGPPTVYRALSYLLQRGLIHRIESLNAYAACACPRAAPGHVFLICSACGEVQEVESAAARQALDVVTAAAAFSLAHLVIEARGLCCKCSALGSDRGERWISASSNSGAGL